MRVGKKQSGKRWRGASTLGCLFACSLIPQTAQAGNLDSYYLSGEAALQGGAIVADSSTGGSVWYNPAGLAQLSGTRLDVNVSGYAVRFGAKVGFNSTLPNTVETRLSLLELDVVPAAVTLTRRFGDFGVGLGVFVPTQNRLTLRTHLLSEPDDSGRVLEFGYDSTSNFQEYHLGPGVGWDVTEFFNVGASLLANYRTYTESTDISASLTTDGALGSEKVGLAEHHRLDSVGVGLELVLGTQWQLPKNYALGFVVRTPSLRLGHAAEEINTNIESRTGGDVNQEIRFNEAIALGTQLLSPFRFHAGLSKSFATMRASVEASVLLPFKNEPLDLVQRLTVNARAGLMAQLSEWWAVGGGIFTDRSPAPDPSEFLDTRIDYYGASFAVNWGSPYGVYAREKEILEEPQTLVFGTTLSFSYALGLGSIAGGLVGPQKDGSIGITSNPADVVAHEFTVHIATSIAE